MIPRSLFFPFAAGLIWGLSLARALAESLPDSSTFYLLPTLLLAAGAALLAALGARRSAPGLYGPLFLSLVYVLWPEVAPRVGWALLAGSLLLTASLHLQTRLDPRRFEWLVAGALALLTFGLYLRTLGPTVGRADTFEFQVVAPTLGVAHPTGYPLYVLSGKLFSLIPLGSVAWRVNLSSAVFGTGATVLLYGLVLRVSCLQSPKRSGVGYVSRVTWTRSTPLFAALAALAFGLSPVFWSQAVVAEVYALHNLFVALVLWLLVDLQTRKKTTLYVLLFMLGLSFTNHLTTALLLPAVALTLALARPRLSWQGWLTGGGLFLLGLSIYLYLYFRWPALHDGNWMSLDQFWRYVTGQQFGDALRLDAWRTDSTRYQILWRLLKEPFGWPGLILAAGGLAWLALKRWRLAFITGVTFGAYAFYTLGYYVPDVSVFVLPAHLILALWIGCGAVAVTSLGFRVSGSGFRVTNPGSLTTKYVLAVTLFSLLPLANLWTHLPQVDQSDQTEAYTWGERVLDLPIAPGAAILADSEKIAPLYYLQRVEGRRPDLDLLVLAGEALYRTELEARLAAGQTVYLARFLPGLEGIYHLRALGPLTQVSPRPLTEPPPLPHPLDLPFGGAIRLLGAGDLTPDPAGGTGLTLYWRADEAVADNYHVRLRLRDPQGRVWWGSEGRHPVNNYYPTLAWRPGEVVLDYHPIPPDPARPPGRYTVEVGLFRPFSDQALRPEGETFAWHPVLSADLPAAADPPAPTHPLRARFEGGVALLGATLPEAVAAGAPLQVSLVWHQPPPADAQLGLVWLDEGVVAARLAPIPWTRQRVTLAAPAPPGRHRLYLSLTGAAGEELAARCGWLAGPADGCVLATLQVESAASTALANLDGRLLLLEAEVGATTLRPGERLPVSLRWQALQAMDEDYTVSVQLLGPDGRLYGQVDAWPVQGTLPTSQWRPGQTVADPYRVPLRFGAPSGRYRVIVVVYLLGAQTRLPVVDEAGRPLGDHVPVGEFEVP